LRRLKPKTGFALIIALLAAALIPGAAVFARPAVMLEMCGGPMDTTVTRADATEANMIVIGRVASIEADSAHIAPEAFLKGPASAAEIAIEGGHHVGCASVELQPGQRVLLSLRADSDGVVAWPLIDDGPSYLLENGRAVSLDPRNNQTVANAPTEANVVDHIRSITEQYAVPAASESEGASLDWVKVVVPTAIACLVVFGIGLYLMKIWHRIDPT
jgi:hypothetical protein